MILYLVPVTILVTYFLLKLYPNTKSVPMTEAQLEEKGTQFPFYEFCSLFLILTFALMIGYGIYYLGSFLADLYHAYVHQGQVYYTAPPLSWMFAAFPLSFGLSFIPLERLYLLLLGDNYGFYLNYVYKKYNYDMLKINRVLCKSFCVFGMIMLFLLFDNYTVLGEKQLIQNPLFSFQEKKTAWADIDQVIQYKWKRDVEEEYIFTKTVALYIEGKEVLVVTSESFEEEQKALDEFTTTVLERTQVSLEKMDIYE